MSIPLPYPNINDTDTNDVQTWSSSKILDYLKPALETEVTKTAEETGAEVTFTDIDPDKCEITKAVIEILPSQQGSGDPSPSNPRTINSFDTVHITQHNADNTESTSYDVSLGSTVYGLTGDCVTGEFEETHGFITFDGSENWQENTTGVYYIGVSGMNELSNCNIFGVIERGSSSGLSDLQCRLNSLRTYINFKNTSITSLADWKTFVENNNIQIAYELATPTAITADPITSDLYEGTNVLSCSPAGTVDIEITCTDTIGNILKKEGIL